MPRDAKSGRYVEATPKKGSWKLREGTSVKIISVSRESSRVIEKSATKYHAALESLSKR